MEVRVQDIRRLPLFCSLVDILVELLEAGRGRANQGMDSSISANKLCLIAVLLEMDDINVDNVTEIGASSISVSSKKSRFTSNVWEFFERVQVNDRGNMVPKNKCGVCKTLLRGGASAGTSHLRRHLQIHEKGQKRLGPDISGNITTFAYDKNVARRELVDYEFTALTCKRDVMKKFVKGKNELLSLFEKFEDKICLTSDVWSSRQKMGYMSLTAHFIDKNWSLNKRIICFKIIEYPHTGESLANHIFEELLSWRIHNKIFSISLDNATNNDVVACVLPTYLMLEAAPKRLFHVRCCAHILNLIVQDGLRILGPSIDKIINVVRSMNSSNKRHELWVRCCNDLQKQKKNIDNDVPHRWNSTYELLEVALSYKGPLNMYALKVNESRSCNLDVPSEQDWSIAQLVNGFLSIFASSTKIFSGVYYPTSCRVISCLIDIHFAFEAYSDFNVCKDALAAMKDKFDKYWGTFPKAFCFATIMDPRFKLFVVGEWLKCMGIDQLDVDRKLLELRTELQALYETYKKNIVSDVAPRQSENLTSSTSSAPGSIALPIVGNSSMQSLKRAKVSSSYTSSATSNDLQMYYDLPTIEVDDDNQFSVLAWWKSNEPLYPIVSRMARDLLTIPASTVASESCFSAGGRVVSEKRACLSPNTIEALICLKDWGLAKSRMQEAQREIQLAEERRLIREARPDWMGNSEDEGGNESDNDSGNESGEQPGPTRKYVGYPARPEKAHKACLPGPGLDLAIYNKAQPGLARPAIFIKGNKARPGLLTTPTLW
ncbi:putative transcription factor/ chromatin remodeling BED-type(Zn) family [Rosa chinensis]|uniref:Putative transcription factor/ chromatin remodeling BED-type(Zn) family n=1 Tax=Rosa chinensis TaxID=74649 RepID=A0A2P6REK9_ROSCH|nr:putative transcription factor/ chromatin remodeling BED-type(Zn) family [Rosa chinensis]